MRDQEEIRASSAPGGERLADHVQALARGMREYVYAPWPPRQVRRDPRSVVSAARSAACSISGLLADERASDEQRQRQRRTSDVQPQR